MGRCHEIPRSDSVAVDEMIIPFQGHTTLKQFTPRKPNPNGIKVFVLASLSEIVLDFEIFQGKDELIQTVGRTGLNIGGLNKLTVGEAAVLRFVKSAEQGTSFYFDRLFSTERLFEIMRSFGMGATGTIKKNLVPKGCKHKTEREMKRLGRGSSDCLVRDDRQVAVTVWYDNILVLMGFSEFGVEPVSECQRYCRKEKKYINIPLPRVNEKYDEGMGGVDLDDQVIAYYRNAYRTNKYTVRTIFHILDLVCSNSWLEYKRDCEAKGGKDVDSLAFKLQVT